MTWFQDLTGITHETRHNIEKALKIEGTALVSAANSRRFEIGTLGLPSLAELRAQDLAANRGHMTVEEVVADVQDLHLETENAGALFQVASQFNLLEMVDPNISPEDGVGRYENDHTQGPACAIACGAGTIFRNYFVPIQGKHGQTRDRQVDCLSDFGRAIGNDKDFFWSMRNGYVLPSQDGLSRLNRILSALPEGELDRLRGLVRFGLQKNTEVTLQGGGHLVSQIYCSALPVAYSEKPALEWECLARLILEAAYEATLRSGVQNFQQTGNNKVFLTLLGGGAFGNRKEWIVEAIQRALKAFSYSGLQIFLVSYGSSNATASSIVNWWDKKSGALA